VDFTDAIEDTVAIVHATGVGLMDVPVILTTCNNKLFCTKMQ